MIRPWQTFAYGCLELPLVGLDVLLRLYLLIHFTEHVGLSLELCLVALALSLFWGLLFEPWAGWRSDQFTQQGHSRWPWILIGCLVSGGALFALFSIPPSWSPIAKLFALLGGMIFLNSAWALAAVPYSALAGEVKGSDSSQSRLIGWRSIFGHLGSGLSVGLAGFYLENPQTESLQSLAWVLVIVLYLLGFVSSLSQSGFKPNPPTPGPFITSERRRRRPASLLIFTLCSGLLFQAIGTAHSGLALVYLKGGLQINEGQIQNLLILFLAAKICSTPIWLWLSHCVDPVRPLIVGLLLFSVLQLFPAFHLLLSELWVGPWVCISGFALGSGVLFEKLLTRLGEPMRGWGLGFTFGLWRMSGKLARVSAIALSGLALGWAGMGGFDPRIVDRSAWVFGFGLAIMGGLATLLLVIFRKTLQTESQDETKPLVVRQASKI